MSKKFAVITIHGMGETKRNYWAGLEDELEYFVGRDAWKNIHFDHIYYQEILQDNQYRVWRDMPTHLLDAHKLRKFMLFSFSDAAAMETKPHLKSSPYVASQRNIRKTLQKALDALGDATKPVVLVAHSLGCQVLSNYIWDSDSSKPQGIWKHEPLEGVPDDEIDFLKLKTKRYLFTSGCNIPIFVAGLDKIVAIDKPATAFQWLNYYDPDDVLGWPLKTLSPSYDDVVDEDIDINAGGLFTSWNTMSHTQYWTDNSFTKPISRKIRALHDALG